MANSPAEDPPPFKRGQALTAAALNGIVDSIVKRIVGAFPIQVKQGASGHVVISTAKPPTPPAQSNASGVVARIASETGTGHYTWEEVDPNDNTTTGTTGSAKELNSSTGITVGTIVFLTKIRGLYVFFFPVVPC